MLMIALMVLAPYGLKLIGKILPTHSTDGSIGKPDPTDLLSLLADLCLIRRNNIYDEASFRNKPSSNGLASTWRITRSSSFTDITHQQLQVPAALIGPRGKASTQRMAGLVSTMPGTLPAPDAAANDAAASGAALLAQVAPAVDAPETGHVQRLR
ncbi:hypothetical protein ACXX9E_29450 [Pseudomonas sp. GNP014]